MYKVEHCSSHKSLRIGRIFRMTDLLINCPLGKEIPYPASGYDAKLLYAVSRSLNRDQLNFTDGLPFYGEDRWMAYELSWLNADGLPQIAIGDFTIPCDSPFLIESKSFKLYLNSFNMTRIPSLTELKQTLARDLSAVAGAPVAVRILLPEDFLTEKLTELPGTCLDLLDVSIDQYEVDPTLLEVEGGEVEGETVYSHLLKSQCLITNQPDWGSLLIRYSGPKIVPESLLRYIVSYRLHQGFHEDVVERVFADLQRQCGIEKLTVFAIYTRRGGLNISPFRSNFEEPYDNIRLSRQ